MQDLVASGVRSSLRVGHAFIRLREDLGQVGEGLDGGLALSARPLAYLSLARFTHGLCFLCKLRNTRVVAFILGTLRTENAVVWKTRGPRVGLGRAPRSKRGKYVVKINNAII